MSVKTGSLYLVPTDLGNRNWSSLLPQGVIEKLGKLKYFIAEREKTARSFLSSLPLEINQKELQIIELDKHRQNDSFELLAPCFEGKDIGLVSEAGLPAVADPGSAVVRKAHELSIPVAPLIGPSSLFLALASSGLNGQKFAFHGYLPIKENELGKALKLLEIESAKHTQTQLFIETPYRNMKLFQFLLKRLNPNTQLCVACELVKSFLISFIKKGQKLFFNRFRKCYRLFCLSVYKNQGSMRFS